MGKPPKLDAEAWVDQYGDALFRFAVARIKNRDIAEDLVQEAFLAAVKSKERFQGKSSEKTWLFGILKHKIINHYRKSKTMVHVQDYTDDPDSMDAFFNTKGGWGAPPSHWSSNPGKAYDTREFLDHFYHCLSGLPNRSAEAFAHREIDGLTTGEICKRLDITESNCWVILYRARMLLRKCLEMVGYQPPSKAAAQ